MITIACPAKINLTLEVLNRREDGYHSLRSVMVPLALADELTVEPAEAFSFRCSDASLENDANLVVRAARVLAPPPKVAMTLVKRIPSCAGLGGGSSDAAGVLRSALRGALGPSFGQDWVALARTLGSDVPFFLVDGGALVEGTGERITASGVLPDWHVLVVKPPVAVSTASAYSMLDAHPRPSRARSESVSIEMLAELQRGDFSAVERLLSNDFHGVIAESNVEVGRTVDALRAAGASNALLAGSGSAVFTLAPDLATIASISQRLALDARFTRFVTSFAQSSTWR
jgi:4-diphosphocytidyl-2-C-methyl-D-erythritol kinase